MFVSKNLDNHAMAAMALIWRNHQLYGNKQSCNDLSPATNIKSPTERKTMQGVIISTARYTSVPHDSMIPHLEIRVESEHKGQPQLVSTAVCH